MIRDCFLKDIANKLELKEADINIIYDALNEIRRTNGKTGSIDSGQAGKLLLLLAMLDKGKVPDNFDYNEFKEGA